MDESVELPDSSVSDAVNVVPDTTADERTCPCNTEASKPLPAAVYVAGPAVHAQGISRLLGDLGIPAVALPSQKELQAQKVTTAPFFVVSAALLLVSFGNADLLLSSLNSIADLTLGVTPPHIALMTSGLDTSELSAAVGQGINVYISSDEGLDTVYSGIAAALEGNSFCSLRLQPLVNTVRRFRSPDFRFNINAQTLSAREWEVAMTVNEGFSDAEAAARLFISVSTLKTHLRAIYHKLGIERRGQLHAAIARTTRPPS